MENQVIKDKLPIDSLDIIQSEISLVGNSAIELNKLLIQRDELDRNIQFLITQIDNAQKKAGILVTELAGESIKYRSANH